MSLSPDIYIISRCIQKPPFSCICTFKVNLGLHTLSHVATFVLDKANNIQISKSLKSYDMKTTNYNTGQNAADEMMVYFTSFGNYTPGRHAGQEKGVQITTQSIIESTAEQIGNKVFLNWRITGLTKNCMFLIQRSINAGEFETIEVKKGICGDPTLTVLYCFLDNEQIEGVVKHQVKQMEFSPSLVGVSAIQE